MEFNAQDVLLHWICERECVRINKEGDKPKPWTTDKILQNYKFCNVKREDDRVTKWVHENWLYPYAKSADVAFAMCVARHFNWPETLSAVGFPNIWDPEFVRTVLKNRRDKLGKKIYTGAYTVSTCGRAMDKIDYSIDIVLSPLWLALRAPERGETLQSYWSQLCKYEGFASFMAGQVVADLKFIAPLESASDWYSWAPLGPGSIRGLNRYFDRPLNYNVGQERGLEEMREIQSMIFEHTGLKLALHNVQNCMCEFDKYCRLAYENGKVRSKYNGLS